MVSISTGHCYMIFCFFNDTATTEIYTYRHTLSLHDALPICRGNHPAGPRGGPRRLALSGGVRGDRSRSEEHTSELQSLMRISYAVFCLKKKKPDTHASINYNINTDTHHTEQPSTPTVNHHCNTITLHLWNTAVTPRTN